jgi:hypothetical protein
VQYILENDVDMLCLDFTEVVEDVAASEDELAAGEKMAAAERRVELKPGGAEIEVTNENKAEYADLVCRWRLMGSIHEPVSRCGIACARGWGGVVMDHQPVSLPAALCWHRWYWTWMETRCRGCTLGRGVGMGMATDGLHPRAGNSP